MKRILTILLALCLLAGLSSVAFAAETGSDPTRYAATLQQAIRLMERNLVDPAKIVSHRFALKDIHEAVKAMGERNRNKVMIHVTEP